MNEIKEEIKKCLETNGKEHTVQNLWDTTMEVLRGNSIATQAYLKKIETFQTTDITPHLQELRNNNKQSQEQIEGRK